MHDGIESGQRIAGARGALAWCRRGAVFDDTLRTSPDEEAFVAGTGDLGKLLFDALLFPADHVQEWIASADQHLQFALHRRTGLRRRGGGRRLGEPSGSWRRLFSAGTRTITHNTAPFGK